jgi:hypothetical protein
MIGYLVMATLLLIQFIDLGIRAWPFRLHSPAWRLGLIGTAAGGMGAQLLALFVIFALAIVFEDRAAAFGVAVLSALSGVFSAIAVVAFSLDVLQVKNEVQASLADKYDIGSVWVILRLVIGAVLFLVLAVSAWRTARGIARQRVAAGTPAKPSWLLSPVRPTPPVPAQPSAEAKTR